MPKIDKTVHKAKTVSDKAKVGAKKGKSSGNFIMKNAETGSYEKGHGKVGNPRPISAYDRGKVVEKSDKIKEIIGYHASSVLLQSTPKPESRMTTIEKMEATRNGISKQELEELKKRAGLDYDQLSHILQVARATLIAKKGSEKFPPMLSEKIMSIADIYSYGYEVFGSEQEFNKWIFQPIGALAGKLPYEILDSLYGREEVKHIIGRIEYGVYS